MCRVGLSTVLTSRGRIRARAWILERLPKNARLRIPGSTSQSGTSRKRRRSGNAIRSRANSSSWALDLQLQSSVQGSQRLQNKNPNPACPVFSARAPPWCVAMSIRSRIGLSDHLHRGTLSGASPKFSPPWLLRADLQVGSRKPTTALPRVGLPDRRVPAAGASMRRHSGRAFAAGTAP